MLPNGLTGTFGSRTASRALQAWHRFIVQPSSVPEPEPVLTIKPFVRLLSYE